MGKNYSDRYKETSDLSQEERDELRDERASEGKDVGVIDRVNADKSDAEASVRTTR